MLEWYEVGYLVSYKYVNIYDLFLGHLYAFCAFDSTVRYFSQVNTRTTTYLESIKF